MRLVATLSFVLLSLWGFCQEVGVEYLGQLVPSGKLPDSVAVMHSNNNLDLIRYQGDFYLAFRTAPSHFASSETRLHILRSGDLKEWHLEHSLHLGADMREPRFVILHDSLYFFFFEGGTRAAAFEPRKLWTAVRLGESEWSRLSDTGLDGFVPWRVRRQGDSLLMSAYYGVDLYKAGHVGEIRLFSSRDSRHWRPLSEQPQMEVAYGEEAEFVITREEALWGVARVEGFGSICFHAPDPPWDVWEQYPSDHKYDSSLLFEHEGTIYLIARRNPSGPMNRAPSFLPDNWRRLINLSLYSLSMKRTALYRLDQEEKRFIPLLDFPSNGDNAFPAIVRLDEDSFLLANYSSDFEKGDRIWIRGQWGRTNIYLFRLVFR